MGISFDDEWSATFSSVAINHDVLADILGLRDPGGGWCLKYTMHVQRRRHRKWRINKKWAKRYGYKEVPMVISNIRIVNQFDDGFGFIGEIEK